jgi:hypothetical protein
MPVVKDVNAVKAAGLERVDRWTKARWVVRDLTCAMTLL